jgi:hypothetical protein
MVQYVNMVTKVKIECPIHGEFDQYPFHHVKGAGCKKCGILQRIAKQKISNDELERRRLEHESKKSVAKTELLSVRALSFIERASKVHNNHYDYSLVDYQSLQTPVEIICPNHGTFNQRPANHYRGQGCPRCVGHVSRMEIEWLDSLGIKDRQVCHFVNGKKFIFDGYDSETNTVYLFHGDYWHGNPKIYEASKIHPVIKKTFGELYIKTLEEEHLLKKSGYKIVSIWETDFKAKLIK